MMHDKVTIVDMPIDNLSKNRLLDVVYNEIELKQKNIFIVTANPEIIMSAKKSKSYRDSILKADFIVPDGSGVMRASEILQHPLKEKITGYDLVHTFLSYASEKRKSVYFFGSQEGVAVDAAINAIKLYPNIRIAGTKNGYLGYGQEVAEEIASTNPDFVFIGLGAPLQENWAAEYKHLFPNAVVMGVGGSFDVLAGRTKRAPQFWLKHNLEWMYRLITQPIRSKRMIKLPIFVAEVYKQKWTSRKFYVKRERHI